MRDIRIDVSLNVNNQQNPDIFNPLYSKSHFLSKEYLFHKKKLMMYKAATDDSHFGYVGICIASAFFLFAFMFKKRILGGESQLDRNSFYSNSFNYHTAYTNKVNPYDNYVSYSQRYLSDPMSRMRVLPNRPSEVFKNEDTVKRVSYIHNQKS